MHNILGHIWRPIEEFYEIYFRYPFISYTSSYLSSQKQKNRVLAKICVYVVLFARALNCVRFAENTWASWKIL